jgi:RNA polymerase sigma-70 factor (ECF subfamily)
VHRDQFEPLALGQMDAVYRLAFHLSRRPDEADELVQETYLRAFRPGTSDRFEDKSDGADPEAAMRSWLFAICHNVFYTRVKKQAKAAKPVDEFFNHAADDAPPDEPPPVFDRAGLNWQHVDARLKAAIDDLKPEYREVLLMWGVDQLKYREIAQILEVPIGTVMSRLHRARKLLMDALLADDQATSDLGLRRLASLNPG